MELQRTQLWSKSWDPTHRHNYYFTILLLLSSIIINNSIEIPFGFRLTCVGTGL
jgi:hypothetical protein